MKSLNTRGLLSSRAPEHVFTSQSPPLAPSPPLLRYCLFLSGCHSNREPPAKRVKERRGKKDRNVRERKRDGSEKRRGREGGGGENFWGSNAASPSQTLSSVCFLGFPELLPELLICSLHPSLRPRRQPLI